MTLEVDGTNHDNDKFLYCHKIVRSEALEVEEIVDEEHLVGFCPE